VDFLIQGEMDAANIIEEIHKSVMKQVSPQKAITMNIDA
jgi:hypothetical protein